MTFASWFLRRVSRILALPLDYMHNFVFFCVDFSEESLAFVSFSKAAGSLPHKFRAPLFRVTKLGLNYILCPYEDFSEKSACPGLGFSGTIQSLTSG